MIKWLRVFLSRQIRLRCCAKTWAKVQKLLFQFRSFFNSLHNSKDNIYTFELVFTNILHDDPTSRTIIYFCLIPSRLLARLWGGWDERMTMILQRFHPNKNTLLPSGTCLLRKVTGKRGDLEVGRRCFCNRNCYRNRPFATMGHMTYSSLNLILGTL